jgi:hypothetical protein
MFLSQRYIKVQYCRKQIVIVSFFIIVTSIIVAILFVSKESIIITIITNHIIYLERILYFNDIHIVHNLVFLNSRS